MTEETQNPLICTKCGQEVPEKQLVCDCFRVEADKERERIGLARFLADQGPLFVTASGNHLLSASKDALTICRVKRFKNSDVSEIRRAQLQKPWSDRVCTKCMEVVTKAAAEALGKVE
jgi:hypothetical protein